MQFGLNFKAAKAGFFDRALVTSKVNKATRRVLSKFGAFVRTRSARSIRTRRSVSAPGMPPSSHTGLLKRFIFFSFDTDRYSVVIGPVKLGGKAFGETPELLEYGGAAPRQVFYIEGGDRDKKGRFLQGRGTSRFVTSRKAPKRTVRYLPRPYMTPAFEAEKPNLPKLWADSVK